MSENGEYLQEELEQSQQVINQEIDNYVDFDQVRAEGISIRMGGRKMKLYVDEENDIPEVEELRQDIRQKFNDKLRTIKGWIDEQVSGMYSTFEGYKQSAEEEKEKYERARIDAETDKMPNITKAVADSGLSVAKGEDSGSFVWLYRDFYWPKYIDGQVINVDFSRSLITPIIIKVETKDYRILSIRVCKFYNLGKFHHYHSTGSTECWGTWSPNLSWSNPSDILKVAQRASQILTEVNLQSLGNENPSGLPNVSDLRDNIKDDEEEREKLGAVTEKMVFRGEMSQNVGCTISASSEDTELQDTRDESQEPESQHV